MSQVEPGRRHESIVDEIMRACGVPGRDHEITSRSVDSILRQRIPQYQEMASIESVTVEEEFSYAPIPVAVAEKIAVDRYKSIVVIAAYDQVHQRLQTTTYGISAYDKEVAAMMAEKLVAALGMAQQQLESYEDYRHLKVGSLKTEVDRLKRIVDDQREHLHKKDTSLALLTDERNSLRTQLSEVGGLANKRLTFIREVAEVHPNAVVFELPCSFKLVSPHDQQPPEQADPPAETS